MSDHFQQVQLLYSQLQEEKLAIDKRIALLEELLSTFSNTYQQNTVQTSLPSDKPLPKGSPMAEVTKVVERYLRDVGTATTATIYEHVLQAGLIISGKNPKGNLSAFLSHDDRFINDRATGWSLKKKSAQGLGDLLD